MGILNQNSCFFIRWKRDARVFFTYLKVEVGETGTHKPKGIMLVQQPRLELSRRICSDCNGWDRCTQREETNQHFILFLRGAIIQANTCFAPLILSFKHMGTENWSFQPSLVIAVSVDSQSFSEIFSVVKKGSNPICGKREPTIFLAFAIWDSYLPTPYAANRALGAKKIDSFWSNFQATDSSRWRRLLGLLLLPKQHMY